MNVVYNINRGGHLLKTLFKNYFNQVKLVVWIDFIATPIFIWHQFLSCSYFS